MLTKKSDTIVHKVAIYRILSKLFQLQAGIHGPHARDAISLVTESIKITQGNFPILLKRWISEPNGRFRPFDTALIST